jgi:hypothetical protein
MCGNGFAQVTIGTIEEPQKGALLQLKEIGNVSSDAKNANRGLGLPRVYLLSQTHLYPMFLSDPDNPSSLPKPDYLSNKVNIDGQHKGLMVYNVNNTTPFVEGLYVWNGQQWEAENLSATNGLNKTSQGSIQLGGELNQNTTIGLGTNSYNQLSFTKGSDTIRIGAGASSAIWTAISNNKGVLLPKVTLTGQTDRTTVLNPDLGLLVFNTGKHAAYNVSGFLYWDGNEWKTIDNSDAIQPAVDGMNCSEATLAPATYTTGMPYSGILKLSYFGGNGGRYGEGAMVTKNGLTFQLQSGKLEKGHGELIFNVKGIPTVSSPTTTKINITSAEIPFYTTKCQIEVGAGNMLEASINIKATVGPLLFTMDQGVDGFHRFVTSPNGKYSVRIFIRDGENIMDADLQIRNNAAIQDTITWCSAFAWQGGSSGNSSNTFILPPSLWAGNRAPDSDQTVVVDTSQDGRDAGWGDRDVYYSGAPEHRSYMWTSKNVSDQTTYILTFMMGAKQTGAASASTANQVKAFLKIEEIVSRE